MTVSPVYDLGSLNEFSLLPEEKKIILNEINQKIKAFTKFQTRPERTIPEQIKLEDFPKEIDWITLTFRKSLVELYNHLKINTLFSHCLKSLQKKNHATIVRYGEKTTYQGPISYQNVQVEKIASKFFKNIAYEDRNFEKFDLIISYAVEIEKKGIGYATLLLLQKAKETLESKSPFLIPGL